MNFFEFYNQHYLSLTLLLMIILITLILFSVLLIKKAKIAKVKTPWFEIAPDSVNIPESEDMAKTRLLLKRQFDYVDKYIDGVSNIFLALEKEIIDDAMSELFSNGSVPKTHMRTCLINSSTDELIQQIKNYLNGLLVINHIGSNKEKIKKYAKSHTCQIVAICKKHLCDVFCKLSGVICSDSTKYWKIIGIEDPTAWAEARLSELLIGLSELRYSDFDITNDDET